jgi:hypothetical protein
MRDLKKSGLSIGYTPVLTRARRDGVRELVDVTLYEVSSVQFPALTSARVTDVKTSGAATAEATISTVLKDLRSMTLALRKATPAEIPVDPAITALEIEFRKLNAAAARWGFDDPDVAAFAVQLQAKLDAAKGDLRLTESLAALSRTIQDFTRKRSA